MPAENLDPATMAVGPAARRALLALLRQINPLAAMTTGELGRAIGSDPGSLHAIMRRLMKAGVINRHATGNGYPVEWSIAEAALPHARDLAVRLYERTAADDGREAGQGEIPVWLGGHPAGVYAKAWREQVKVLAARGAA